jgi:hypothetical protein
MFVQLMRDAAVVNGAQAKLDLPLALFAMALILAVTALMRGRSSLRMARSRMRSSRCHVSTKRSARNAGLVRTSASKAIALMVAVVLPDAA